MRLFFFSFPQYKINKKTSIRCVFFWRFYLYVNIMTLSRVYRCILLIQHHAYLLDVFGAWKWMNWKGVKIHICKFLPFSCFMIQTSLFRSMCYVFFFWHFCSIKTYINYHAYYVLFLFCSYREKCTCYANRKTDIEKISSATGHFFIWQFHVLS